MNDVFYKMGENMLDTLSIDKALSEVRRVKENFDMKQGYVNREDYRKLCNCEHDLLGARDVINMINSGNFDKYYNE